MRASRLQQLPEPLVGMELSERGENGASTAKGASGGGASRSTSRKPDPTADSRRGVRPAGAAAAGKLGDGSDDEGHYLLSRFTRGADAYADTCVRWPRRFGAVFRRLTVRAQRLPRRRLSSRTHYSGGGRVITSSTRFRSL